MSHAHFHRSSTPYAPTRYPAGGYSGHYFSPAAPPPPSRPPRRRGWLGPAVIALVVVLLGLLALGGYGAYRIVRTLPEERPPVKASPVQPAVYANQPGTAHTGDLRQLMLPAPAGMQRCRKPPGTNEILDLDQAAADSARPGVRKAMLQKYGFQRGAARCWEDPSGPTVLVALLQFDSADHAAYFLAAEHAGMTEKFGEGRRLDGLALPGGALHLDRTGEVPGGVLLNTSVQRGDVVAYVYEFQIAPEKPEHAITLLAQQYARL